MNFSDFGVIDFWLSSRFYVGSGKFAKLLDNPLLKLRPEFRLRKWRIPLTFLYVHFFLSDLLNWECMQYNERVQKESCWVAEEIFIKRLSVFANRHLAIERVHGLWIIKTNL